MCVDFPEQNNWTGLVSEMELVPCSDTPKMEEEKEKRRREVEIEEDEKVKSKASDEVRKYEEELAARQREMEELARKLEKTKGEIDNLRLATQLQKEDLAEGHKALWR